MDDYIASREVWRGPVTKYEQPGSFPATVLARLVEIGHMRSMPARYAVELLYRDALAADSWRQTVDVSYVSEAYSMYIQALVDAEKA